MKRILIACVLSATVFASQVQAYTTSGFYQADDTVPINWVDIVNPSNLVPLSGDDVILGNIDLGFPFPFFGQPYTKAGISTNGFIQLYNPSSSITLTNGCCGGTIPSGSPQNMIAPLWDDVTVAGPGAIYKATSGSAPNRKFITTWSNVDFFSDFGSGRQGRITFQLILSELDQSVTFQYLSAVAGPGGNRANGSTGTIGLQDINPDPSPPLKGFIQYSADQPVVHSGLAIRFTGDSDGDGFPDQWEIQYGTDPHNPNDPVPTEDVDGDGLDWRQEFLNGTSPLNSDTDGDGLSDGDEVLIYHTNPLVVDTDGDGASDGLEVANGSDPLSNDLPNVALTLVGPGASFGTAYFQFVVGNPFSPLRLGPATRAAATPTAFRVFYGPVSVRGNVPGDYPAFFDINPNAREGIIDQKWGLQGVPQVFFRIAAIRQSGNLTFLGPLSNEHEDTFEGILKHGNTTENLTATTSSSSNGCSFAGRAGSESGSGSTAAATLAFLFLPMAVLLLRRKVRRKG